jgi:hypothetical protein
VVDARLAQLAQKWPITRHGANLFSQRYFENMIIALAQRLEEDGCIELERIAVEHELRMEFTQQLVLDNLDRLKAELDGKQLITKEYTLLEKAKVLGFLSAIRKPLQVEALIKAVEIEPKNVQRLILELLEEGKLRGRLSNGYFIPSSFSAHQRRIVNQFVENNGYLDGEMLQRKFMIAQPEEWIQANLGNHFVSIEHFYFTQDKLESIAGQLNSLLRTEGYVELAHVLPVDFTEHSLREFLEEQCGLREYFLCEGYCYSNEWLERLTLEFKHKVIYSIFFKKAEPKGKEGKKKGKKEGAEPLLNEEELQEVLFNGGYADYTMAETLASELLGLLTGRLEDMRKKTEKELASSKGLISSSFLKYKACKTILRTEESLCRMVNIIQKQIKKGEQWLDQDFGPSQQDPKGLYACIYYDNVLPKGWPSLDALKWSQLSPA